MLLQPIISADTTATKLKMTLTPVLDALTVNGNPTKSKILRRVAKLFKASKTPIKLDEVNLTDTQNFNFENPLNKQSVLLPKERKLLLAKENDNWRLILKFQ